MQREIKFKAKRIDNNEWVIGVPYPIKEEGKIFIVNNCKSLNFTKKDTTFEGVEVNPETVCQFTGLLDKNDNDIYEGDKIKHRYSEDSKTYYIIYDTKNVSFMLNDMSYQNWANDEWYDTDSLEVISNIHD